MKRKVAQTKTKKLIRRTCPSGHGSDGSGLKWHAPPCSESAAQKKSFRPQRRGIQRSPQAIQEKSRPSPSNCVTPSACKLLSERGFGFRIANVVECRVSASHFPSDAVQNEAVVRGSTPPPPPYRPMTGARTRPMWPNSLSSLSIGPL